MSGKHLACSLEFQVMQSQKVKRLSAKCSQYRAVMCDLAMLLQLNPNGKWTVRDHERMGGVMEIVSAVLQQEKK